jgi:hypothetical protein
MTQAVIIYTAFCMVVLLICWCGTQLTQHVRDNYLLYFKEVVCIMRRGLKKLGNESCIEQSVSLSIM